MKLHRLELEGFGPFLRRQSVDFDAFADDGLFLIAGRTGAGKSSILDGVCFALYGGVPRYEGGDKRLRSDHCAPDDPTEVTLEFSTAGRRWRITRSPQYDRPKSRGTGLTTQQPQALLEVRDGEAWTGVAARPRDVGERLDEILGLSQQQFLQVILLAQNRFARFLLAANDERQGLLRTLFGTRTYEQYAESLEERRKQAEQAVAADGERVSVLLDSAERLATDAGVRDDADADATEHADAPSRLAAVVRASERAAYRAEAAGHALVRAEADLDAALAAEKDADALADAQRSRLALRARQAELDAASPGIATLRTELQAARAAEELRDVIDAAQRAESAARTAGEALESARDAWSAAGEMAATAEALRARDDELAAILAACADGALAEGERRAADLEAAQAQAAADDAQAAVLALDAQRAAVPEALAALDAEIAGVAGADARRDAARERVADATLRRDAAREADRLAERLRAAEREMLERAAALQAATAEHTALLQRRLDSAAADLAAGLVDGEPCPVCGGTEHPHPAAPAGEPVTDADLDAAAAGKQRAWEDDQAAAARERDARAAHAAAAARAGGLDAAQADAALADATGAYADADADAARHEKLRADRAALAQADAEAAAGREALVAEAAAHRQSAALAAQRSTALKARIDTARADAASIDARRADTELRRTLLSALRDALADAAVRAQIADDARRERDVRLAASAFADAGAVRAALRDAREREAWEARIAAHDADDRACRQQLLERELELADRPDEPVDIEPFRTAVADARAAVTAAASACTAAESVLQRLRELSVRADAAYSEVSEATAHATVIARLAHTVAGRAPNTHRMTLETFVLAAELEEIVAAANVRLAEMSAGRYRLRHSDARAARGAASGLGLEVMDAFTGQARPPQSLSGGETFLASLALALGLAEVVTARAGGIRLDTLFIDEGFGSLDDETLDLAMRALDELRQGGRTVGVISHVAAMKEQIPAQLHVSAGEQGPSVIRQDVGVPA
ncbi:AAA family ATPase [Microbacterium sp. NPDC091313]